ncbi:MAG: membrane protease YdiL (CAAX protease family) [Halioglobus sp.]|jgi:membrane protease YdiL (CAAX protease family)
MLDLLLSVALWSLLLLGLAFCAHILKLSEIRLGWLVIAVLVFAVYIFLVKTDVALLAGIGFSDASLKLNIDGKLIGSCVAVIAALLLVGLSRGRITAQGMGLTWRQNEGSSRLAIIATVLFVVFAAVVDRVIGKSGVPAFDAMTMLYPLVAGLDEELMYRGVLMALLCAALPGTAVTIAGVRFSMGGLVALLLFSIIHGVKIKNGLPSISPPGMILTLVYGGVFLWLREKTGSLVWPTVAHNLGNTVGWLL